MILIPRTVHTNPAYQWYLHGYLSSGTVFVYDNAPTSVEIQSEEYNEQYQIFKDRFVKDATFLNANKNYTGPTTGVSTNALNKLTKEVEANETSLVGPRLEDGSYYAD